MITIYILCAVLLVLATAMLVLYFCREHELKKRELDLMIENAELRLKVEYYILTLQRRSKENDKNKN